MTVRAAVARVLATDGLNFVLTNRIPRRTLTRFMGWFSRIEQPIIRDLSIATWRWFSDVDLTDARRQHFRSLHDCFTRELKAHARPIDSDAAVIVSPCDAIVGAAGAIDGETLIQAKGFPYPLEELLSSTDLAASYVDGTFVTLRLTAGMYHRFHAPYACRVRKVVYVAGDQWNVNPPALRRVPRLYCKNSRAIMVTHLEPNGGSVTLVAVGAVLVSSIRLPFLDAVDRGRQGDRHAFACDARFAKGDEMGWFEHGSTIIVLAPQGYALCDGITDGRRIAMGRRLMTRPALNAIDLR